MKRLLFVLLCTFSCFILIGCGDNNEYKRMPLDEVAKIIEKESPYSVYIVEDIAYATDSIKINGLDFSVDENIIHLGN